jgi:hypothetical protein
MTPAQERALPALLALLCGLRDPMPHIVGHCDRKRPKLHLPDSSVDPGKVCPGKWVDLSLVGMAVARLCPEMAGPLKCAELFVQAGGRLSAPFA